MTLLNYIIQPDSLVLVLDTQASIRKILPRCSTPPKVGIGGQLVAYIMHRGEDGLVTTNIRVCHTFADFEAALQRISRSGS